MDAYGAEVRADSLTELATDACSSDAKDHAPACGTKAARLRCPPSFFVSLLLLLLPPTATQNVPSEARNQRTLLTLNPNTRARQTQAAASLLCCALLLSAAQPLPIVFFHAVPTSSQTKLVRGKASLFFSSLTGLLPAMACACESFGGGGLERERE
jgi:hypothetical protein